MKIYTKTGDQGSTSLFSGDRVLKSHIRVELYGTIDELTAIITVAMEFDIPSDIRLDLNQVMQELFILGTDFATPLSTEKQVKIKRIETKHVTDLEDKIDIYFSALPEIHNFIFPGGTKAAAFINQARTVCRRAERIAVSLNEHDILNEYSIKYLNRLSDYLFATMRYINFISTGKEKIVNFNSIV